MIYRALFAGLLPSATTSLIAEQYHKLDAEYMLAGKLAFGDIKQGCTHLYLKIKDGSAENIYDALAINEINDECVSSLSKTSQNLSARNKHLKLKVIASLRLI